MDNDVKGRIKEYLKTKGSNPSKIAAAYSANQKTISSQINGTTTLSVSTILLILDHFPRLSAEWLLRGIGTAEKGDIEERMNSLENKYDTLLDKFNSAFSETNSDTRKKKKGA